VDLNENTPPRKRRSSLRRVPSSETKRQAHELVTRTECLLHKFHRNFMSDRVEPWQEEHLLMQRLLYAEERQEFEQLKGHFHFILTSLMSVSCSSHKTTTTTT
jgi:hypothetical protein